MSLTEMELEREQEQEAVPGPEMLELPSDTPQAPPAHFAELDDSTMTRRLEDLPREVGVMLMAVGVLGWVLPGVVGGPAVIAGGLVLWPSKFRKVESWLEKKFPKVHHLGMRQIGRYLDDLERRYPDSTNTA
jgi:hypothetical protein